MPRLLVKATLAAVALAVASPLAVFAAPVVSYPVDAGARKNLDDIYAKRPDLQAAFGADGSARPFIMAKGLVSLDDWAARYGVEEYPALLFSFAHAAATAGTAAVPVVGPRALKERPAMFVPVKATAAEFAPKPFTATSVIVIDDATRKVLLSRNAGAQWPIASISKLMTALVSVDSRVPMGAMTDIRDADDVGGAKLRVPNGQPLTVRQVFDAMLVGSANNAANALARTTGLSKEQFVAAMNARAGQMGMPLTRFVDPTGIETGNVSTAEGVAALAFEAFDAADIRRATTTAKVSIPTPDGDHLVKNTNWILTDPDNGLYVTGGKTGYLIESRWNFVVRMKDARNRPVLVVVLGSSDRQQSFNDATAAAKWVWNNYKWQKSGG